MSHMSMERRPPLFYGWFVVAAAFGVTFVGFGGAYSFSAFFELLQREFAASRGSVSSYFRWRDFSTSAWGSSAGRSPTDGALGRWPSWGCSCWASVWRSRARPTA